MPSNRPNIEKLLTYPLAQLFIYGLLIILAFAWYLPSVKSGLPYFYNEDEAHHFNRVVEMVQKGDYNPNYFHKPSLHFYLRMPVIAAGFFLEVRKGNIKSIQEIKTRDRHGLSGYSFTASHPGIVKWNRLYSLGFVLLAIGFTVLITFSVTNSIWATCFCGLSLLFSPAFLQYGATIGVDSPMLALCTASVFFAFRYVNNSRLLELLLSSLSAGLAISTKYNALPIIIAPVMAVLINQKNFFPRLGMSLCIPILAFFLASPFIFTNVTQFLDHFAYEIWHYGVASHAGHSAEPGLSQVVHYFNWIAERGLSLYLVILGLVGITFFAFTNPKQAFVLFAFPVCYFLLMIGQRANFERNMLVVLPFLAFASSYVFHLITRFAKDKRLISVVSILLMLSLVLPEYLVSRDLRLTLRDTADSRDLAFKYIQDNTESFKDVAVAGNLQLPLFQVYNAGIASRTILGLERLASDKINFFELYQKGFNQVVVGPDIDTSNTSPFLLTKEFAGENSIGRIIKNPNIKIYDYNQNPSIAELIKDIIKDKVEELPKIDISCTQNEEQLCWLENRITVLKLEVQTKQVILSAFSPWQNQELKIFDSKFNLLKEYKINSESTKLDLALDSNEEYLYLVSKHVHSPQQQGLSTDSRRLGIALQNIKLE